MALQTSGAISINDLHVEVGGTSGTTASLNDSDIRALIGVSSGASNSLNSYYGASSNIYQATSIDVIYVFIVQQTTSGKTTTTTGYTHRISLAAADVSHSNFSGFIHGGGPTSSTIGSDNFLGSTGGATYNAISSPYWYSSYTISSGTTSNQAVFGLHHYGRGQNSNTAANYNPSWYPAYNASTSVPTGFSNMVLTFTKSGTNAGNKTLQLGSLNSFQNIDFTSFSLNPPSGGVAFIQAYYNSATNIYNLMGTPYSNQYIGGVAQTGTIATNGVLTIS
tara:strand:+ start:7709 stop:8542 length:834 start_codon:yes stop_codon:yes gene_type:complete